MEDARQQKIVEINREINNDKMLCNLEKEQEKLLQKKFLLAQITKEHNMFFEEETSKLNTFNQELLTLLDTVKDIVNNTTLQKSMIDDLNNELKEKNDKKLSLRKSLQNDIKEMKFEFECLKREVDLIEVEKDGDIKEKFKSLVNK